jgi:sigma-54 dependent transcriptional regulator, acetoin dehydrogenase operon transcriptional activator AcoR
MASEYRFLREARDRFLSGEPGTYPGLRGEILESWQRSAISGVRPEQFEVPYQPDLDTDGVLQRAARPVLDHLAEDLSETGVGVLLTNEQAEVLDRRAADRGILTQLDSVRLTPGYRYGEEDVGTNAIGTALTLHRPSIVLGGEHFVDALGPLACVAVTFDDPSTGRSLGVLDVTCEVDNASALMLPFVRRIAREVEQSLVDGALVGERILREHFLRAKRWAKGPIVSLNKDSMMTNRAAANIVNLSDQALLWEFVQRGLTDDRQVSELTLTNGMPVTVRFEPVTETLPRSLLKFSGGLRSFRLLPDRTLRV